MEVVSDVDNPLVLLDSGAVRLQIVQSGQRAHGLNDTAELWAQTGHQRKVGRGRPTAGPDVPRVPTVVEGSRGVNTK